MTAVSLLNPLSPQPAAGAQPEPSAALQSTAPPTEAKTSGDAGLASDQSGQGAGNGTGTGGAQLNALLKRGRDGLGVQLATSESVVGAQSKSGPAGEFLARQAQLRFEAEAAEEQRAADRALQRAEDAKAAAAKAAEPKFIPPNPVPTAPILKGETG
ncbi:MAG: hypothetical protein AAGF27_10055 [Pseudomonadota bacterium]